MNCPVCSKEMIEEDFGVKEKVFVCENGCKSIWFPHWALQELDQNNEGVGKALEAALNSPRVNNKDREPLECPICHIPMHRHLYARSHEVNVDECYNCEAFFLDSGELSILRSKAMTDNETDSYVNQLVEDIPQVRKQEIVDKEILNKNQGFRDKVAHKFGKILQNYFLNRSV